MLAKVHTFVLFGIEAIFCEVEADLSNRGLPQTLIVGLPQAAVKESAERVKAAMENSGFPFPKGRRVINLAPADVKKEGPSLDLAIAVGLLRSSGSIVGDAHLKYLIAGELALDGSLRRIKGALPMAILARARGFAGAIVPVENAREAAVVEGIDVIGVSSLGQVAAFLNGNLDLEPTRLEEADAYTASARADALDFADVRGQEAVKRAITIAAAGSHNILMIGPPGTGKSMLASRIPGILPRLSREESLETTQVYSALGLLPEGVSLMDERPVRTPHHSATAQALIGGGSVPRPGEVSLAHNGVLFLDELPEFPRTVLETLRQPLESGEVTISRVHGSIKLPARIMLVAAMNPSASGRGESSPRRTGGRDKYLDKVSGPLLDRIDIHVEVPAVPYRELTGRRAGTSSQAMRDAVKRARQAQHNRFNAAKTNGQMSPRDLKQHGELSEPCLLLMKQAMEEMGLSARAYDKVRRVSRTIADLEGAADIAEQHIAEAVQYRLLDRRN